MNTGNTSVVRFARCLRLGVLVSLVLGFSCTANSADPNPLSPLDTSSPRAALRGFIETIDEIYGGMTEILEEYARSDRLYLTQEERRKQIELFQRARKAVRALDISTISPVLKETVAVERIMQLKEILDRIELPEQTNIPDMEEMGRLASKRWRLPGTEIDFVLIKDGPRAGEYQVSAETMDRLPEFYEKVATLPYKPGPAKRLNDTYRALNSGKTDTLFEAFQSSPIGLASIVPLQWMLNLPGWAKVPTAELAAWQWLGLSAGLLIGALFIFASHRLARRIVGGRDDDPGPRWAAVPVPLAVILVATVLMPMLTTLFRIGGPIRVVIAFIETMAFSLTTAWLCIVGLIIVGDLVVSSEHLKRSSLDGQLIRLGARLVGVICAIVVLIQGADELGFPAYSVVAGLGVGGLAVALAARDSLANLLGSLLIMFEKPFRIGHYIKVGGNEGTVEDVGFRSTRIRTPDNSLLSIPNNTVVNTMVENVTLRAMRRQRFFLQVTYDTPRDKVEKLVAGVRQLIVDHLLINQTNFQVCLNNFSESSLDILVLFYLNAQDYTTELSEREVILLQTMDLAREIGVEFAFPTRTLQIETTSPDTGTVKDRPVSLIDRWNRGSPDGGAEAQR